MSSAIFTRLIDDFRSGWLASRHELFNLEVRSPGRFYRVGIQKLDTVDYEKEAVIATVCLPYTPAAEQTAEAILVVAKRHDENHTWLPSQESIDEFERLCAEAGVALPLNIRNHLAQYHTWETARNPQNWWVSVLVALHEFTVNNADGMYQERQFITNPWQASIDAIEYLKLNAESPCWPEEEPCEVASTDTTAGNIAQMVDEIRDRILNPDISDAIPDADHAAYRRNEASPVTGNAEAAPTGFLGGKDLVDALEIDPSKENAFFRQLERKRIELGDNGWHEVRDPRPNSPKFLYRADSAKLRSLAKSYREPKPA